MNRFRPRREVKMWLYLDKSDEEKLAGYVAYLKKTRKLAKAIRDGLRLIWSLGEGDTTILFELFPAIEKQLVERFTPPPTSTPNEMQRQIEIAVEAGVQKALVQLPALPAGPLVAAPPIKPSIVAPVATITAAKPLDAGEIADNFLAFLQ